MLPHKLRKTEENQNHSSRIASHLISSSSSPAAGSRIPSEGWIPTYRQNPFQPAHNCLTQYHGNSNISSLVKAEGFSTDRSDEYPARRRSWSIHVPLYTPADFLENPSLSSSLKSSSLVMTRQPALETQGLLAYSSSAPTPQGYGSKREPSDSPSQPLGDDSEEEDVEGISCASPNFQEGHPPPPQLDQYQEGKHEREREQEPESEEGLFSADEEDSPSPMEKEQNEDLNKNTIDKHHKCSMNEEERELESDSIEVIGCLTKQVAGHSSLLRAKGGKVCKPLSKRELWFYQSLASEGAFLKPFTPTWYGCAQLTQHQLASLLHHEREKRQQQQQQHLPVPASASELSQSLSNQQKTKQAENVHMVESLSKCTTNGLSSWSEQLSNSLAGELNKCQTEPYVYRPYIVIDDITWGYKKPCILDVKMGKQEVKHSQGTTTSLYGFRILGMMVYEPHSTNASYRQFNKYQGRALNKDNIHAQLAKFFYNGSTLRTEVLPIFVEKLKILLSKLKAKQIYKIMTGSLLFIYEGVPDGDEVKADVKMIDFQHAYPLEEKQGVDDGYCWGLENLIALFEDIRIVFSQLEHQNSCSQLALAQDQPQTFMQLDLPPQLSMQTQPHNSKAHTPPDPTPGPIPSSPLSIPCNKKNIGSCNLNNQSNQPTGLLSKKIASPPAEFAWSDFRPLFSPSSLLRYRRRGDYDHCLPLHVSPTVLPSLPQAETF
jgi:hypothetical protein